MHCYLRTLLVNVSNQYRIINVLIQVELNKGNLLAGYYMMCLSTYRQQYGHPYFLKHLFNTVLKFACDNLEKRHYSTMSLGLVSTPISTHFFN